MYYWHRNPQCSLPPPTPLCALPCSESDRYMRIHARTNTYICVWALVPGGKLQTARPPPFLAFLRRGTFARANCQTKWTMSYKVRSLCVAAFNSPRIDFLIGTSRESGEKKKLCLPRLKVAQKLDVFPRRFSSLTHKLVMWRFIAWQRSQLDHFDSWLLIAGKRYFARYSSFYRWLAADIFTLYTPMKTLTYKYVDNIFLRQLRSLR